MARASFKADFKVAETVGRFAEGPNSPLQINNRMVKLPYKCYLNSPRARKVLFESMFNLCLVCANQRKLIAKVRGDSNDFLTYATMGYVVRWKKQFEEHDARRPVDKIQNWIPYILNTIRFALISFNKEAYDYDFLPLPRLWADEDDSEGITRDLPDRASKDPLNALSLEGLTRTEALHSVLLSLPIELKPYLLDILYYIRTHGTIISEKAVNFIKVGRYLFAKETELWLSGEIYG